MMVKSNPATFVCLSPQSAFVNKRQCLLLLAVFLSKDHFSFLAAPQAIYPVQTTTVIYAGAPQGYEVPGTSNAYFFPAQDPTAPPGYPANAPPPMYPAAAGPSAPPAYPQQSGFGHMNAGESK